MPLSFQTLIELVSLPPTPLNERYLSESRRISRSRTIPGCLLICNQEFDFVPTIRTREWLRETQFYASDGGKSYVSCRWYSWRPMDSQPPAVWTPYSWSTERDFRSGFVHATRHHRTDVIATGQETILRVLLRRPVGFTALFHNFVH